MIEAGLIVARFLHFVAVTTLAGASFFPLYAYPGKGDRLPLAFARRMQMVVFFAANITLASGILWFIFTVANISGTLEGILDRETLAAVLGDTSFGKVWTARLVLTIMIIVVFWNVFDVKAGPRRDLIAAVLATLLLISLAGVGHAQVEEGVAGAIHLISDAAHLLAASAWLGGLAPLALIIVAHDRNREIAGEADLDQVLMRFSGMGYVAVATLVGSGLVNSWFLVGSFSGLLETAYGQMLVTKLILFVGMLALAVSNRFWIVPALGKAPADGPGAWAARLRNQVLGEQVLGLMVLLIVSILGTMPPATGP